MNRFFDYQGHRVPQVIPLYQWEDGTTVVRLVGPEAHIWIDPSHNIQSVKSEVFAEQWITDRPSAVFAVTNDKGIRVGSLWTISNDPAGYTDPMPPWYGRVIGNQPKSPASRWNAFYVDMVLPYGHWVPDKHTTLAMLLPMLLPAGLLDHLKTQTIRDLEVQTLNNPDADVPAFMNKALGPFMGVRRENSDLRVRVELMGDDSAMVISMDPVNRRWRVWLPWSHENRANSLHGLFTGVRNSYTGTPNFVEEEGLATYIAEGLNHGTPLIDPELFLMTATQPPWTLPWRPWMDWAVEVQPWT